MKTSQIAREVTQLIRERQNRQAKDTFYSNNIVSIEANGDKREGIEALYQKSIDWATQVLEVHSVSVSDPQVAADHFSLNIKMDISYKNGYRAVMDEIAVYEVNDGKIVLEQFFYRP
ncbi:SnoaL-like domain-containing protein [Taibaiella koreensis]|uniref:SnoaL-like domain-containing protein n=1 Tax=Taibaiella koreensis TaxID=1268548 RepID=UPI000E59917A|nr:SnoaL-like domain-containing protein [Taibaiella koreensis]